MVFRFPQKVLFKHCDPAGIVFYPRYFEMLNDAVEALFADVLLWPFEDIHPTGGVPTVAIDVVFKAPSRHGDQLILEIALKSLGRTSLGLQTTALAGDQVRFVANHTLVLVDGTGRPAPWPDAMRQKITEQMDTPI